VLVGIGNGEAIVVIDVNITEVAHRGLNLVNPLGNGEHRHFIGIVGDQNDHPVKQPTATGNNV
jgi:hypothetical protein